MPVECPKEPSTENHENLKTPGKENQSIIWESVLLRAKRCPQFFLMKPQELYCTLATILLYKFYIFLRVVNLQKYTFQNVNLGGSL